MKTPHDPPQFRIVGKPVSLRLKSEGDRVHAMPRVPRRQSLPLEDVAQMAPAASTLDLYALAVRVGESTDGSRNLLVKRRPAATSVELVVRPIEGCPALLAFVRPGFGRAFVLPREGWLGALVEDHPLLGSGQRSEGGRGLGHTSSIGKPYHSLMGRVPAPRTLPGDTGGGIARFPEVSTPSARSRGPRGRERFISKSIQKPTLCPPLPPSDRCPAECWGFTPWPRWSAREPSTDTRSPTVSRSERRGPGGRAPERSIPPSNRWSVGEWLGHERMGSVGCIRSLPTGGRVLRRIRARMAGPGPGAPDLSLLWAEIAGASDPGDHLLRRLHRQLELLDDFLGRQPDARSGTRSVRAAAADELAMALKRLKSRPDAGGTVGRRRGRGG